MQYLLLAVYSILAMTVLHVFKSSLLLMDIEVISSFSLLGKRLCRVLFFFFMVSLWTGVSVSLGQRSGKIVAGL